MADLTVTPVAGRVPVQPGMTLADMLNLAQGVQQYKQTQQMNPLQLEAQRLAVEQAQAVNPLLQRQQQAATTLAETTLQPKIQQQTAVTQTAQAQARAASSQAEATELQTARSYLSSVRSEALSLLKNPTISYDDIVSAYKTSLDNTTAPKELKERVLSQALSFIPKGLTSDQYRVMVGKELVKTLGAEGQLNAMFPAVSLVQTGAAAVPVTTGNVLAVQPPGTPLQGGISMELPPTTETVITREQAERMGKPELEGARVLLGAQPPQTRSAAPVVSALSPTQAAPLVQLPAMAGEHWKSVQQNASTAQADIGVLQNIKKYAKDAFTGVGGARKELAAGIANAVGIPAYEAEKTATDVLAKNSNLLALAGGNTDLARTLAEAANPNKKMNEDAIRIAADQLMGIKRMALAQQRFLSPFQSDPRKYMENKQLFDQIADPRLFQEISPEDVRKLKKSMSPAEVQEMTRKIELARRLGVL